jgi:hypothetical protein
MKGTKGQRKRREISKEWQAHRPLGITTLPWPVICLFLLKRGEWTLVFRRVAVFLAEEKGNDSQEYFTLDAPVFKVKSERIGELMDGHIHLTMFLNTSQLDYNI